MLKIPLFTAEALLRNNGRMRGVKTHTSTLLKFLCIYSEWSRELLLEKWMKDPIECCQLAGVQPPSSVLQHGCFYDSNTSPDSSEDQESRPETIVS